MDLIHALALGDLLREHVRSQPLQVAAVCGDHRLTYPELDARVNRLAQATSPYLLQHKNNPVDWYEWGEEALERAKKEDKVIFLSIGYSACHWCHVMEHESFENEQIADFMNAHYVNIKEGMVSIGCWRRRDRCR